MIQSKQNNRVKLIHLRLSVFVILLLWLQIPKQVFASAPAQPDFFESQNGPTGPVQRSAVVSYLYVDPNEAGAGGGHTALRIGDSVFHYQQEPSGYFIVDRISFDAFLYIYSRLENRNIYEAELQIDDVSKEKLIRRLTDHQVKHRFLLHQHHILKDRLTKIQSWQEGGAVTVEYPVLGYFRAGRSELWHSLSALGFLPQSEDADLVLPGDTVEVSNYLEQSLHEFLSNGFDFSNNAFVKTSHRFRPELADSLQTQLRNRLAATVSAPVHLQPDRARTALELLVLLESVRRSSVEAVWIVPKMAFADEAAAETSVSQVTESIVSVMAKNRLSNLEQRSTDTDDTLIDLVRFFQAASIEDIAKRYGPMTALSSGITMTTPALGIQRQHKITDSKKLIEAYRQTKDRLKYLELTLQTELSYSLFTRNCATELVSELQAATGINKVSNRSLTKAAFVPSLSFRYIQQDFGNGHNYEYRSFRNDLLADVPTFAILTKESFSFTAGEYRLNDRDSLFIFFTEQNRLLAPLYGVANLSAGLAQSAAGVVMLPFDGGDVLSRGVRGSFFSLTELFFLSIRKGTYRSNHHLFAKIPKSIDKSDSVRILSITDE